MNSFEKVQGLITNIYRNVENSVANETNALKVLNAQKQLEILSAVATELQNNKEYYFPTEVKEEAKKTKEVKEVK